MPRRDRQKPLPEQSSPHPDVERAISVLIGLLARQAAREAVHIQDPQQGSNDRDP